MYIHIERRMVRLLSRCYDLMNTGYKFLKIGKVGPPSYVEIVLRDIADTNCRCFSKRGRVSNMKYLQDVLKRIQGRFHKRWIANGQSLYAERCYDSSFRPYA